MPSSVVAAGISGLVAGSGFSLAGGLTFGFSWSGFISSLVLQGLSRALQKKPQSQQAEIGSQGRLVNIRQPISSWQIIAGQARVGGTITFVEVVSRGGDANNLLNLVITFSGHAVEEIGDVYFNDELLSIDGNGVVNHHGAQCLVVKSLGDEAGQPFPGLVTQYSDGKWTDAHRQSGRAKLWVALPASADAFPTGIPVVTAVIKGAKLYDTRDSSTAWSANAALWTAHYLTNTAYGLGADYTEEIDTDDLDAAASVCDEAVTLAAGGTEARYEVNGAFLTSEAPQDVLGRLLGSMAGKAVNHGAAWHIYAGAYYAPTVTLDESDLAGPIKVQSLVSRRENCNGVKGIFTDPNSSWQPTDFPAIASATYMAEDNDERVWRDVDYSSFVTSGTQAQRLAKIELLRTRQPLTVVAPHKLTAFGVVPGRTVSIDNTKFGFSAKAFDVESSSFTIDGEGALGVQLAFRETVSTIYDWSTSEELSVDPAPNTTLPDPFDVAAPGTPTVVDTLYETTSTRRVQAKMEISWAASANAFVTLYEVQYRLSGAASWTILPRTSGTTAEVLDIAPGTYEVRVKGLSQIGISSDWSPTTTAALLGLSAQPSALTDVNIQKLGSQAIITFTQSADLDVRRGGRILVRHSEAASGASWEASFSIGNELGYPGDAVHVIVPLKSGTYLLKPEDTSGQQSVAAAAVASDGATALTFANVDSITEDTTFTGTHDNTVATGSVLKLVGTGLIDDIPDFDSISSLDSYGGIVAAGTYTFSAGIDCGSKKHVQAYGELVGVTENVNDLIDERTALMDDWVDFDGSAGGGSCDAWLEARVSDDNVTYGDWNRCDRTEFHTRYLQFRLRITSNDPAYNLLVSQLRAHVQEVV